MNQKALQFKKNCNRYDQCIDCPVFEDELGKVICDRAFNNEDISNPEYDYLNKLFTSETVSEPAIEVKLDTGAKIPIRAHEFDGGVDLCIIDINDRYLKTQSARLIDTGVHISIPEGYVGLVMPKSGLAAKGIIPTLGVIDAGYTGSIKVNLVNYNAHDYQFFYGDKIAQLVIVPCLLPTFKQVDELKETERGDNGFGSTGR